MISDKVKNYSKHGNLDKYIGKHIEGWAEYRKMWKAQKDVGYPLYVVLEQFFKCNFRCKMCAFGNDEQYKLLNHGQRLNKGEVKWVIDQLADLGTPSLALNAHNEPLMDNDLPEYVKYARDRIIDVFFSTNGSLLTEETSHRLIDAGLTQIRFSLDAFYPETYKRIRYYDLKKVEENIFNFLRIRGSKVFPIVRVSFLEMEINRFEWEDFRKYWGHFVDLVSLQRYTPLSDDLSLVPERRAFKNTICTNPQVMLYIRGNGDVYPCCFVEYGEKIGNIKDQSIKEIWDNGKEIRRLLNNSNYDKLPKCKKCMEVTNLI